MRHTRGSALFTSVVLLVALSSAAHALTNAFPPLFRETPAARSESVIAAADDVNYRLPNNTEPVQYNIQLTTSVHTGERAFSGTVKIELNVLEDTRTIVVHARQLKDFVATVRSLDITNSQSVDMVWSYEDEREFLSLTPTNTGITFTKNSKWELSIAYKGELRTNNGGFYLSSYVDDNNNTRYLATTQFESTDARHAFPCYDEPAKRAKFTITINHSSTYNAISNMPVNTASSRLGTTVFETTVIMPTYLVAFIVSDFKYTEGVLNALPQRIYSRPGTEHDHEWALVSGMLIIERLAKYYGVEFPLPKMDQVAVPDFAAGAMENWGLVTYREEYLLYNDLESTVNTQTNVANIIAHEYTHQWFGNLVAIKWWTYLWLKEGFATLFSYHATDEAYPEWGIYDMFHTDEYIRALNYDGSRSPRPLTHYVQKPSEISSLYDSVSYSKGGSVLRMWQHALTDKVFQRGLHNYLNNNKYSAAEEDQLFTAIETAAKELNYTLSYTIKEMFSTWTRQGGFPLLTVKCDYKTKSFVVTQEAFFNNETFTENKSWYVPINYAVQSNSDFRNTEATSYLSNASQITVTDVQFTDTDWLILNKQSTGYYRINYENHNWKLIINGLIEQHYKIHPRNRAQLMNDAYLFATSNRLEHSILIELLTYLKNEDQYAAWSVANGIFTSLNRYFSSDSDYVNFQGFVRLLVNNIYEKLGVNDIPGEQHFQKYTRSIAINLACLANIQSCLQETNKKLNEYINQGIDIEPNLQSNTYCNGLKQSGDAEFNFVYDKLMNSENQAERRLLISSLGCAQQNTHAKKFVESSIDKNNKLRVQERTTLLSSTYSRGPVGLSVSIDFLNDNWLAYSELTPGFGGSNPLDNDIRGMSQYVVDTVQEKKLMDLVQKVKSSDKVSQNLEEVVTSNINSNYGWLAANRNGMMKWITTFSTSGSTTVTASFVLIASIAVFVKNLINFE